MDSFSHHPHKKALCDIEPHVEIREMVETMLKSLNRHSIKFDEFLEFTTVIDKKEIPTCVIKLTEYPDINIVIKGKTLVIPATMSIFGVSGRVFMNIIVSDPREISEQCERLACYMKEY